MHYMKLILWNAWGFTVTKYENLIMSSICFIDYFNFTLHFKVLLITVKKLDQKPYNREKYKTFEKLPVSGGGVVVFEVYMTDYYQLRNASLQRSL